MKLFLTIAALTIGSSCFAQRGVIHDVEWLTGTWTRTNAKPGRSGVEIWNAPANKQMIGKGINLKGADTTFVEKLKIVEMDGKLFYVADVPENKTEVPFGFTALTKNSFVCENPSHDFPKKIEYTRDGNQLKAVISGNGKSIEYLFQRK